MFFQRRSVERFWLPWVNLWRSATMCTHRLIFHSSRPRKKKLLQSFCRRLFESLTLSACLVGEWTMPDGVRLELLQLKPSNVFTGKTYIYVNGKILCTHCSTAVLFQKSSKLSSRRTGNGWSSRSHHSSNASSAKGSYVADLAGRSAPVWRNLGGWNG